MSKEIRKLFFVVFTLIAIILLLLECPSDIGEELRSCYYTLCSQLFLILFIWVIIILKAKRVDLLEPIVLISFIHVLIFEITPIVCIINHRIEFFGAYVWGGCIKGTIISSLGYICILIAYYTHTSSSRNLIHTNYENENADLDIQNKQICLTVNYGIWIFGFLCGVIIVLGYGLSIKYLLTGGSVSLENETTSKSIYGFLSIFSYCMIPSFLYIFELGNNKIVKIILFYLMIMTYYVRGFRFIMVAVFMAPIIYHYLKNKKRPSMVVILAILIGLVVFSGYMQWARASIRSGQGTNIGIADVMNVEELSNMLIENFEIVKTYYAIVEHFPRDIPYTLGSEIIIYTIVMLIPRFAWSSKPTPAIYKVIGSAINGSAREAGTSYPYIGEYYFEFGPLGVCFFCYVLGKLVKVLHHAMYGDKHSMIAYSCIFPLLLQVMIRGYTPTNFYMILACLLPVVLVKKYVCQR